MGTGIKVLVLLGLFTEEEASEGRWELMNSFDVLLVEQNPKSLWLWFEPMKNEGWTQNHSQLMAS